MISDETVRQIIDNHFDDLVAIYIFGSASRKELRADSDIDIAILTNSKLSALELYAKSQILESQFKRPIDLIDLQNSSTVFAFQVLTQGRKILEKSSYQVEQFEYLTYSKYAKLNEERRDILKSYGAAI